MALLQLAVEPPKAPTQFQVRVVPQDVAPLSPELLPAAQAPPGALLLHEPLTGVCGLQLPEGPENEPLVHTLVALPVYELLVLV